jgi:hypothetical protein
MADADGKRGGKCARGTLGSIIQDCDGCAFWNDYWIVPGSPSESMAAMTVTSRMTSAGSTSAIG